MKDPGFTPEREREREPGAHFPDNFQPTREIDFFSLFFTQTVIQSIVNFTNIYAAMHILDRKCYSRPDGSWEHTTPGEIKRLLGLCIYFGLVQVGDFQAYWGTAPPYHGLWARRFLTKRHFLALLSFFHVVSPNQEQAGKNCFLYESILASCMAYHHPRRNISINDHMIRFKGRNVMKMYIKNKPTKWGFKSFSLCDSLTKYIYNFELYTGQQAPPSEHGLTHDLIMRLCHPLLNQGYTLLTDNYYTSAIAATHLHDQKTSLVGTCRSNRTGFSVILKDVKAFERYEERGAMRCQEWPYGVYSMVR